MVSTASAAYARTALGAFSLDAVLVAVFAILGRASHDSEPFGIGLAQTAWPFLASLLLGWFMMLPWRRPLSIFPTAVGLWVITVVGGMLLRVASGQGTALPFIIVATLVLAALLIGWRVIAAVILRALR